MMNGAPNGVFQITSFQASMDLFAEENLLKGEIAIESPSGATRLACTSFKRGMGDDVPRLFSLVLDGSGQLIPSRSFNRMPTNARGGPETADIWSS